MLLVLQPGQCNVALPTVCQRLQSKEVPACKSADGLLPTTRSLYGSHQAFKNYIVREKLDYGQVYRKLDIEH